MPASIRGRTRSHSPFTARGRLRRFPCFLARAMPARTLSAINAFSNCAKLARLAPALQTYVIRLSESFPGDQGTLVFKTPVSLGLEGVIAKRRQSVYQPGMRSRYWVKIPVRQRGEFVVGGYLAPTPDHLSTLIVGQYDRGGKLRYAGLVGTGLPEETRRVILRELQATRRKTSPFSPVPILRDHFGELRTDLPPQWVKPTLVVDVQFRERKSDGLRHAEGIAPRQGYS